MKKSILLGGSFILLGAMALGATRENIDIKNKHLQGQIETVSGEIIHIDEDSYTSWGTGAGSSVTFENIRVKGENGKVHKLIYLGPSSYKKGDKVNGLEYKCLADSGIQLKDLNILLTSKYTRCQTGYIHADGIITEDLLSNIRNYLR